MAEIDLEKLIIFDLETTGLESDCRIVQVAITRGERIFQSLVNPGIPIPPESTEIHRIRDEDVADAPRFEDIADQILEFVKDGVLSGFNIRRFDLPVMKREIARAGRKFPPLPLLDLYELNLKMNPRSLAWFFEHYSGEKIDHEEAHDAVYDCICTRKGFLGMFKKHEELPTDLEELARFAEPDHVPIGGSSWLSWVNNQSEPSFSRGKYRGWTLSEISRKEPSYIDWLSTIDADAMTKNIVNLFRSNKKAYISLLKEEHPLRWEPRYLEFRQAMDHRRVNRFPELVELAGKTEDPSLVFLAAAWACQLKEPRAKELAIRYLKMDDPNVNIHRRRNYLQKNLDL